MSALRLRAPAKINLALEVTGRRPDGYHDIDTVMTTIDLADDLRLSPARALEVVLSGAESKDIDPVDDLSGRAARALAGAAGREPAVRIEVTKRIPSPAAWAAAHQTPRPFSEGSTSSGASTGR